MSRDYCWWFYYALYKIFSFCYLVALFTAELYITACHICTITVCLRHLSEVLSLQMLLPVTTLPCHVMPDTVTTVVINSTNENYFWGLTCDDLTCVRPQSTSRTRAQHKLISHKWCRRQHCRIHFTWYFFAVTKTTPEENSDDDDRVMNFKLNLFSSSLSQIVGTAVLTQKLRCRQTPVDLTLLMLYELKVTFLSVSQGVTGLSFLDMLPSYVVLEISVG